MNTPDSPLLISLRPRYADLVFEGLKKAELRRRDLTRMKGRDVFVYVTSPVKALRGGFHVGEVIAGTPDEIWEEVSSEARLKKSEFDAYYAGRKIACALKIKYYWEYENPLELSELRAKFRSFVVPQSWRYLKAEELESFLSMELKSAPSNSQIPPNQRNSRQITRTETGLVQVPVGRAHAGQLVPQS